MSKSFVPRRVRFLLKHTVKDMPSDSKSGIGLIMYPGRDVTVGGMVIVKAMGPVYPGVSKSGSSWRFACLSDRIK
jgi:hypothetical protein